MYAVVTKEPTLIVMIPGEFVAEGIPYVSSIEAKSWRPRIMNKDDGEVVIRWFMIQDTYFCKQGIEKSSRDLINSLDVVGTVWKSSGISVTIRSVLNRVEDRDIQIN